MELLKALAHPDNQGILIVLAAEPSYARRVAALLGMTETQVTRRLRHMESLGLVEGEWQHIGRNVKMYRPTAPRIQVRLDAEGLHVEVGEGDGNGRSGVSGAVRSARSADHLVDPFESRVPEPPQMVGRDGLVTLLASATGVVGLEGIAGIGKSSIMATAADQAEGAVFWHAFRGVESMTWLVNRLAVFLASHGQNDLVHAIHDDADLAERREVLLSTFDQRGLHYYFDDVHAATDEPIRDLLRDMAAETRRARLRLAGRETLPIHTGQPHIETRVVEGLADADARGLLEIDGVTCEDGASLTPMGGHPLALHLLADVAKERGVPVDSLVAGVPPGALVDFLLREVDAGLNEAQRRVMAHASVFRLGFSLDDLQGLTRARQATLLQLQAKHLVEADGARYVMHDLVRVFFEGLLDDAASLHDRLSEHFAESGTVEGRIEAMHHLLCADRQDAVLEMLEHNFDLHDFDLVDSGYTGLYAQILARFHEADVDERTWALIQDEMGDIRFQDGDHEAALAHYAVADGYFRAHADDTTRDEDIAWKRAMAMQRLGREEEAKQVVDEALPDAPPGLEKARLERLRQRL